MPQGEAGEIRARGPQIMQGYRGRPNETRAALRDGYLYTGDIGKLDDDGYLHILDRKKDMVDRRGIQRFILVRSRKSSALIRRLSKAPSLAFPTPIAARR